MKNKIFILSLIIAVTLTGCSQEEPATTEPTEVTATETTTTLSETKTQTNITAERLELISESKKYETIINLSRDILCQWIYMENNKDADNWESDYNKIMNIEEKLIEAANIQGNENLIYELGCSVGELRSESTGYAVYDLNNDGTMELIIMSDYMVHAVYTLHNNQPTLISGFWSRHSCKIDESGTLYIHGSGGACDNYSASYTIAQGKPELVLIEMTGIESYADGEPERLDEPRYYRIYNGNKTIISQDEAYANRERIENISSDIKNKKDFEFKLFKD